MTTSQLGNNSKILELKFWKVGGVAMRSLKELFLSGYVFGEDIFTKEFEDSVEKDSTNKAFAILHNIFCHFELIFVFHNQVLCVENGANIKVINFSL